ncbi:HAD-superfamily subfamily IB hydrolase, TIGR01490 [Georgenia satyanarayanai]|uniref:HAD-superfamily subfamily IB hydrolase, TIGR01490 n=1 Tax=Georgenia satyanarayanai TaxID=860221 RepID=A0A2Y9AJE7_9MICO|nr:HAD-IB family hydrolase [Georgenia satyanarayanai]PYF99562.1 HAD superfamily hydrolase (TIGR01490 family) [Georgenia satyanarayanai]SSA42407.1 HAD-superfamily subfamily IB hydrolase, TIGR01490 [Georgenia satyanarayanai]
MHATTEGPGRDGAVVAAFFDVDNTIIRGASAYHLARELYRRDFFGLRDIAFFAGHSVRYFLLGEDVRRIAAVRSRALGIVRGRTVAEIISIGEEVYDQVLANKIFPGARALIEEHLAAGHEVWLVSATPAEIADLIAGRLGATGALGTIAEHEDGVYTGELRGNMLHGEGKKANVLALAQERGIDLARSHAYGDSVNDIPLLSTVGSPCAINPEPRMRLHAVDAGWPVRDFRRRRRDVKKDVRTGVRGAGWAGAVWAATAVLRALRRRLIGS